MSNILKKVLLSFVVISIATFIFLPITRFFIDLFLNCLVVFPPKCVLNKQLDWDYLQVYIDYLNVLVVVGLGVVVLWFDNRRHEESQSLQEDLNRPILAFKMSEKRDPIGTYYRFIQNVGKGSALNIIVAFRDREPKDQEKKKQFIKDFQINNSEWKVPVELYPLEEKAPQEIFWKSNGRCWIARYEDIFGNVYFTCFQNERNITFLKGNKPREIGKSEWDLVKVNYESFETELHEKNNLIRRTLKLWELKHWNYHEEIRYRYWLDREKLLYMFNYYLDSVCKFSSEHDLKKDSKWIGLSSKYSELSDFLEKMKPDFWNDTK